MRSSGRGRTVAEITASTRQVAEGVKSCASITELAAKHQCRNADRGERGRCHCRRADAGRDDHGADVSLGQTGALLTSALQGLEVIKRLGEVGPQVLDVLDPDRHSHQTFRYR